ncbi:hypothetical protein CKO25_02725 [Thiocapsa imhoffii]|uniref:Winged helix-turn-helix domain-containing protein n=1 Tax=Thiocapsa imhoffii TaxID=382777 RepID=A0A9X0WFG3_9GAMM|nr:helix-turn-helix domain-containing protein [Thiocapsa imhoffii]MBK1643588.1 hypothetical protein [Thiocapsa imhoffii]
MAESNPDEKAALGADPRRGSQNGLAERYCPAPSRSSQCARLLRYLQHKGRADTRDIRSALAIMSPAARVYDLRHRHGHDITSVRDRITGIATYVLMVGGRSNA